MARYFYSLILYLLAPLIFLHLIVRGFKSREYWYRWRERLGFIPKINQKNIIWIHAVSVGEVMAAIPLIKNLQKSFSGRTILVTTTTPTGSEQVLNSFGSSVKHFYIPYDFNGSINRFMKCINPAILILMETELWPNTINYCTQKKNTCCVSKCPNVSKVISNLPLFFVSDITYVCNDNSCVCPVRR